MEIPEWEERKEQKKYLEKKKAEFFQVNINKTKFTEGKTPKPRYVTFKLQKIKKKKKFWNKPALPIEKQRITSKFFLDTMQATVKWNILKCWEKKAHQPRVLYSGYYPSKVREKFFLKQKLMEFLAKL